MPRLAARWSPAATGLPRTTTSRRRFQKPILFYWLVSAAYLVAGRQRGGRPGGSALAGLALALLTASCGRRWYDERTARLAGLIVATAFGYFSVGRLALARPPARLLDHADDLVRPRRSVRLRRPPASLAVARRPRDGTRIPHQRAGGDRPPRTRRRACLLARASARPHAGWRSGRSGRPRSGHCGAVVRRDGADTRRDVHRRLLRRRQPRAVCHEPVQRSAPPWFYLPIVAGGLLPWTPLMLCGVAPLARWATPLASLPRSRCG